MSRSFKKTPIVKDATLKGPTFKSGKQMANRRVRRKNGIPQYGGYRKVYRSYNISEYAFRMSESDLRMEWKNTRSWLRREFKTYDQAYRWWKKTYLSK